MTRTPRVVGVVATKVTLLAILHQSIAADFHGACHGAPIAVFFISVITLFAHIEDAITTNRQRAIGVTRTTRIIRIEAPKIALLPFLHQSITADGLRRHR